MPSYVCTVTITNATDPAKNDRIKTIAGTFLYYDGTSSPFGGKPRNDVDLGPGDRVSYQSMDKCVVQFFFYVTVREGGDSGQDVTLHFDKEEAVGCLAGEWVYAVQV